MTAQPEAPQAPVYVPICTLCWGCGEVSISTDGTDENKD